MLHFFKKKQSDDPIAQELQKLRQGREALKRQAMELEFLLQHPQAKESQDHESSSSKKRATFITAPNSEIHHLHPHTHPTPSHTQLKIQRRNARNRFLILAAVAFILFLLLLSKAPL